MITGSSAIRTPERYEFHLLSESDSAADLNAWAESLFSPQYSPTSPAFLSDGGGLIHVLSSGQPVPAGWYVVFGPTGQVQVLPALAFEAQYTPQV